MKIATHNVEFLFGEGTHTHSGQEWVYTKEFVEARVNHFSKLFAEIDADILLLQEVASKDVIEQIIAKTKIDYLYFFAEPDQNGVGNAVLYKQKNAICKSIPAVASLPVFVEGDIDTLGPRIWSRRDFVHIETAVHNRKLHVIGIHIKANFLVLEKGMSGETRQLSTQITATDGIIRSEIFRFSQAKKVREIIDALLKDDPNAMIVVGGDFNAEENSSVFRIIQGYISEAPDALISATRKIVEEDRFPESTNDKPRLIDHILISKSIDQNLMDSQILNKELFEHKNIAPVPSFVESDHAPVVINLNL